jgi:hypothetical protein
MTMVGVGKKYLSYIVVIFTDFVARLAFFHNLS